MVQITEMFVVVLLVVVVEVMVVAALVVAAVSVRIEVVVAGQFYRHYGPLK